MLSDSALRNAFETMVEAIEAPPVRMTDIDRRRAQPMPRREPRFARAAIAAAAAIAVVASLPAVAPGLAQSIDERIAAFIHWTPPSVPPPKTLLSQLQASPATPAQAQARVSFTIVPPSGLPRDIVSSSILTAPTGTYTRATQTWQLGPQCVYFSYKRAHGRSFTLLAHVYDPRTGMPGKYMYDGDRPTPDGMPLKLRHFVWRNGSQVMEATADDGITESEIAAIITAMHGTPVPLAETRAQNDTGSIVTLYTAP